MNKDHQWQGCYGDKVSYQELDEFLEDAFALDELDAEAGAERFATCIWGHTGIGKTSKAKQFLSRPVEWRGEMYDGYDVRSVPIAQFEEMGDLHGLPDKHVLVRRSGNIRKEDRWVPIDVVQGYVEQGWYVDHEAGTRTMYAPPDWVPTKPGPSVLILDDFNRAGGRIIKGVMQLLQEYGLMSWKLPPGCHIVMTANPDEQDYFVTTIDSAVLQRMRCCTLKFDSKEWAVWATQSQIDPRVISYVLAYPEMVTEGVERTSPRSISEFGRYLTLVGHITKNNSKRVMAMAYSLLDESTVGSLFRFIDRDFEMVVSPEDIIAGKDHVKAHLKDIMSRQEKRIDVLGVTCDRLFAYLSRPDMIPEGDAVKNFQDFITCEWIEPEMRYVFVDRLERASNHDPKMDKWYMGNRELHKLIMEVV
jgi:MoxR-like ATPase